MPDFLFGFFVCFTLLCAVGVVLNRNAVNAAMCLLLCLAGVAALFVRLDAFLLAFLLILVYAGAVVALFLFIVMLLDAPGRAVAARSWPGRIAGGIAAALVLAGLAAFAEKGRLAAPPPETAPALGASLKLYAWQLFTAYLLPVEVMGFLLLIAMLGVIALSRKSEEEGRLS